jgi:hypothetical protein
VMTLEKQNLPRGWGVVIVVGGAIGVVSECVYVCVERRREGGRVGVGGAMVLAGCVVVRWCLSSFPSASGQASPGTLASAGDPCWESAISGGLICLRREGRLAGETIGRQSNNNVSRYVARHDFCCVRVCVWRPRDDGDPKRRISASASASAYDYDLAARPGRDSRTNADSVIM